MKLSHTRSQFTYHPDAYRFVFDALKHTQEKLQRGADRDVDDESAHISGPELLEGVRELALQRFGLMAQAVFGHWGISSTDDFGRIVFELVERGQMRKTEQDRISDFFDVYAFEHALNREYVIPTDAAFA